MKLSLLALISLATVPALSLAQSQGSGQSSSSKTTIKKATPATAAKPKKEEDEPKEGPAKSEEPRTAAVSSIEPEALEGFEHYAPQVQQLVRDALALTKQNLTYTFGSANPKQGGMDCSGTIYYLLKEHGFKDVPRQSNEMCEWVQVRTLLYRTPEADSLKHPEFTSLQPGNLLFWTGTYEAGPRTTPVTHVMLYLGKLKKGGRPVMFGASDGRSYQSERRTGVSVFDFTLPKAASQSKFYGYGLIPGVGRIVHKAPEPQVAAVPAKPVVKTPAQAPEAAAKPVVKAPAQEPTVVAAKPPESVTEVKPATKEPEEVIKRAIILPPETVSAAPAKSSPAAAVKPKTTNSSTSTMAKRTPAKPKSSSASQTTSTAKRTTTTRPKPAPEPDLEAKIRQKAREVGDSLKKILSR